MHSIVLWCACGDHMPRHDEGRSSVVVAHKVVLVMASGSRHNGGLVVPLARRRLTSELLPYHCHNLRSLPKCVRPSWPALPRNPFYIDRSFLASITGVRSGAISAISKPAGSGGVYLLVSRSSRNKGTRSIGCGRTRGLRGIAGQHCGASAVSKKLLHCNRT